MWGVSRPCEPQRPSLERKVFVLYLYTENPNLSSMCYLQMGLTSFTFPSVSISLFKEFLSSEQMINLPCIETPHAFIYYIFYSYAN